MARALKEHCWREWWQRKKKDVSLRFKILNLLSGDRLRPAVAFTGVRIEQALECMNDLPEKFEDLKDYEYEHLRHHIYWVLKCAQKNKNDIWTI